MSNAGAAFTMPHLQPLRPDDPARIGRYRLTARIAGIPSTWPVYLAAAPGGTQVTVSTLRSEWTRDAAARDRFAAEAAVARRVPPFCAARILDDGFDGGDAFLISEYVDGPSLFELVAADGVRRGAELEGIAIGMATGLASIHQTGLVHANFGPDYVIVGPDGPKVVEFGITPPYGTNTPSADMAAWAETVAFAAAGRPPTTMADLDVLPDHVRAVVAECLLAEPAERPTARTATLALLGNIELPAGLLAEGSRRAARASYRAASYAEADQDEHAWLTDQRSAGTPPGRSATQRQHGYDSDSRRTGQRPARQYGSHQPAAGQRVPAQRTPGEHTTGQRAAAQHSQRQHASRSEVRHRSRGAESAMSRRLPIIAGIAVVVVAAVVGFLLVQGGGSGQHPAAGSTSPRPKKSSPSSSATPTIPAGFAGTWSGQVSQLSVAFTTTIKLTAGAATGSMIYAGNQLSCSGDLTLVSATSRSAVLALAIVGTGTGCDGGRVTLVKTAGHTLRLTFRSNGATATGTLSRHPAL
jgi:hypothetical protein